MNLKCDPEHDEMINRPLPSLTTNAGVSVLTDLCVGGCCRVVGLLLLLALLQLLLLHQGQLLLVLLVLLCREHCGQEEVEAAVKTRELTESRTHTEEYHFSFNFCF